ncbi:hypothetical protein SUGI_0600570 [Cryptomeria japonica]|nr:hypothetical protein SUGI_0600570 [Cryptomeria japonica]
MAENNGYDTRRSLSGVWSIAAASMWGIGAAHKKMLVGTTGMVASVILYVSPLSDIAPNFLGIPLASTQMILYCVYSQKSRGRVEDVKLTSLSDEIAKEKCTKLPLPQTDIEMQLE